MAPKFLCCLPLRLGVFVISFIQFLLTGASAAFAWWILWYGDRHDIENWTNGLRIGLIVYGAVYTAAAVLSFIGFLGAIFKKMGAIRSYLLVLYCTVAAQIAIAVFVLITYYRARNTSGSSCIVKDDHFSNGQIDICAEIHKIPQWAVIITVVIPIIIEAYACYVVQMYNSRLRDQKRDSQYLASTNAVFNGAPAYIPVARSDEAQPLTEPAAQYPYSDKPHSFGGQTHHYDASNHA